MVLAIVNTLANSIGLDRQRQCVTAHPRVPWPRQAVHRQPVPGVWPNATHDARAALGGLQTARLLFECYAQPCLSAESTWSTLSSKTAQ
jgi:hypothetical protein